MTTTNITDHFTLGEATTTSTGLPNVPDLSALNRLSHTFAQLERVRTLLSNRPVHVHSAYRSPDVNRAVGGVPTSQHTRGEAVDFDVQGLSVPEAVRLIAASDLPYDQLIDEAASGRYGHVTSWVHVSFVSWRAPRRQVLVMRDGRYTPCFAPRE